MSLFGEVEDKWQSLQSLRGEIHKVSKGLDTSIRNLNVGQKLGREYLGHFIAVSEVTDEGGLAMMGARGDVSRYLEKMEDLFQAEKFLKSTGQPKEVVAAVAKGTKVVDVSEGAPQVPTCTSRTA